MSNDNINGLFDYVWCGIISTVTGLWVKRQRNGGSISGTDERFSTASKVQTLAEPLTTSYSVDMGGYFHGGKAAEG
jgi:hypothetical protein